MKTFFFDACDVVLVVREQLLIDLLNLWFDGQITTLQAVDAWMHKAQQAGIPTEALKNLMSFAIKCMGYPPLSA